LSCYSPQCLWVTSLRRWWSHWSLLPMSRKTDCCFLRPFWPGLY